MRPFKEQFTLRGVIIGILGCVIITASSVYVALKLGALPWPIFFVVLLALFALKLLGRTRLGATNINEVNVSASIMSAGAMVAGGLAFTIPGIYILMPDASVPLHVILVCAVCGVGLGAICTSLVRKHFIEDTDLPFPIGKGAAETLEAGDKGGHKAALLFGSLGFAGIFTVIRDFFGMLPTLLFNWVKIPGVTFGIYFSPMAIAMGFMIGPMAALVWYWARCWEFWHRCWRHRHRLVGPRVGSGHRMSLGIGVMIGCGVGIIIKVVIPRQIDVRSPLSHARLDRQLFPCAGHPLYWRQSC